MRVAFGCAQKPTIVEVGRSFQLGVEFRFGQMSVIHGDLNDHRWKITFHKKIGQVPFRGKYLDLYSTTIQPAK